MELFKGNTSKRSNSTVFNKLPISDGLVDATSDMSVDPTIRLLYD